MLELLLVVVLDDRLVELLDGVCVTVLDRLVTPVCEGVLLVV